MTHTHASTRNEARSHRLVLKGEAKAVSVHVMKAGTAPLIFNLGTRWKSVLSFTPWPLYTLGPFNNSLG